MKRMDLEQMDLEMDILTRMNQKLNFLRNPRHVKGAQRGLHDPRVKEAGGIDALKATLQAASQINRGHGDSKKADSGVSAAYRTQLAIQTMATCGNSLRHPLSALSETGIVAEPAQLEFKEYHPGGVFEAELVDAERLGLVGRVPPRQRGLTRVPSLHLPGRADARAPFHLTVHRASALFRIWHCQRLLF